MCAGSILYGMKLARFRRIFVCSRCALGSVLFPVGIGRGGKYSFLGLCAFVLYRLCDILPTAYDKLVRKVFILEMFCLNCKHFVASFASRGTMMKPGRVTYAPTCASAMHFLMQGRDYGSARLWVTS